MLSVNNSLLLALQQAPRRLVARLLSGPPVEFRNRTQKAKMIEGILRQHIKREVAGLEMLDIGCGNGDISRYFAGRNRVTSVDLKDRRGGRSEPFEFRLLDSERLPMSDESFDVVLSHHVIEHVPDQALHLREIHRALRPRGVAYIATPNKTSPIMRGHIGNSQVLHYDKMTPLFESQGFRVHEHSTDVFVYPDRYQYPLRVGRWIPAGVARALRAYYPSHMFTLTKRE